MRRFRLEREQYVACVLETTFAFFSQVPNLERLTPPWLHFEIISPCPSDIEAGTRIDYRLRLRGFPIRWQSEITVWEPPYSFVDVQRQGPYRLWEHTHTFERLDAGTVVRDVVVYGLLGDVFVNRFLVRPHLDAIFDFRARELSSWALEHARRAATDGDESEVVLVRGETS